MPRGDRTGPRGLGKMTGRGAGYCTGNNFAGFEEGGNMGRGYGFGFNRGQGFGRGFGNRGGFGGGFHRGYGAGYWRGTPANIEINQTMLEGQIKSLEEELKILTNKLKNLKKNNEE